MNYSIFVYKLNYKKFSSEEMIKEHMIKNVRNCITEMYWTFNFKNVFSSGFVNIVIHQFFKFYSLMCYMFSHFYKYLL
jgi:hypothetical protein